MERWKIECLVFEGSSFIVQFCPINLMLKQSGAFCSLIIQCAPLNTMTAIDVVNIQLSITCQLSFVRTSNESFLRTTIDDTIIQCSPIMALKPSLKKHIERMN